MKKENHLGRRFIRLSPREKEIDTLAYASYLLPCVRSEETCGPHAVTPPPQDVKHPRPHTARLCPLRCPSRCPSVEQRMHVFVYERRERERSDVVTRG